MDFDKILLELVKACDCGSIIIKIKPPKASSKQSPKK